MQYILLIYTNEAELAARPQSESQKLHYARALELSANQAEQRYLRRRLAELEAEA